VRPTYVVGPDDYSWRFPWWVARIARGGDVLAPGPEAAPAQVIDVRDMATWMVGLFEQGAEGAFHAVSPEPVFTWRQELTAIADAVAPAGTTLTWVDADFVHAAGLPEGTLPLWSGDDPDVWTMGADPAKAYATGLSPRPLVETARDTLAWVRTVEQPADVGLDAEREAELLAAWHGRAGGAG
jgi:2'-hydroxyisoflavone reductase